MTRLAIVATILVAASGCDKLKGAGGGSADAPVVETLDLAARPHILFQVFGERSDTRILPLAAVVDGVPTRIELSPDGWRRFAAIYEKKGTQYRVYDDGRDIGTITVRQGMWEDPSGPLYSLPNCTALLPLAAVKLDTRVDLGFTVDLLATSAPIAAAPPAATMPAAEIRRIGREMGQLVGQSQGISRRSLDGLDFRAFAVNTGATPAPTVIASFIDPGGGMGEDGQTLGHVFVIGDARDDGTYAPTFSHAFAGSTANAEYRVYLNHLDLTGDGLQEIIVEARLTSGGTYVAALGFQSGGWHEIFRSRSDWCLDGRR